MRDNFFNTFVQLLTGRSGDQLGLVRLGYSDLRWFTVVLFWALLSAGIAVAVENWRRDPLQRTGYHVLLLSMGFIMAGLCYMGTLWKLPWPVSDGFKFWLTSSVKFSQFQWHADLMQIFLNHISIAQPLVYMLEIFFNLLISLYNDPTEWPWTYVVIVITPILLAVTHAGRSFGLDNLLDKRLLPLVDSEGPVARVVRLAG